jgi:hypothetical protein
MDGIVPDSECLCDMMSGYSWDNVSESDRQNEEDDGRRCLRRWRRQDGGLRGPGARDKVRVMQSRAGSSPRSVTRRTFRLSRLRPRRLSKGCQPPPSPTEREVTYGAMTSQSSDRSTPGQQLPPAPDAVVEKLRALAAPGVASSAAGEGDGRHLLSGALFARLKALNRAANAAARTHKQATADARQDMDQTHLGLQNLLYEKRHLEREIEKCRQFAYVRLNLCEMYFRLIGRKVQYTRIFHSMPRKSLCSWHPRICEQRRFSRTNTS